MSVPEEVTSIGQETFGGCTGLRRVELPTGLVGVSAESFKGCGSLKSLLLPNNTKTVGLDAFAESGLKWIVVPDSLAAKTGNWGLPEGCEVIPWSEWKTLRTAEGVPYEWLYQNGGEDAVQEEGWEAAANADGKNGRKMRECYVAGLGLEAEEDFAAVIKWEDGKPVVEASKEMPEGRVVKIEGRKGLEEGAADWEELKEGEDWKAQGWRFFWVRVALE